MPEVDVQELVRSVEKISANLKQHIAAEAQTIGAKYSLQHAKAADERIQAKDAELQRAQNLVAEQRRQMEPLLCRSAAYLVLEKFLLDLAHASDGHDVPVKTLTDALAAARAAGTREYKRLQSATSDA